MTTGNISANRRPARSAVSVSSALAVAKRSASIALAHEGADDADAGELLAQDLVDRVDALLHRAEQRHHPA